MSQPQTLSDPILEKKIKTNFGIANSLSFDEEGPCMKDDLLITSSNDVETNFNHFIKLTNDVVENKEIFKQYEKLYKLNIYSWPSLDEAHTLFQKNLADTRKRSKKWSDVEKRLFYWVVIRYCLKAQIFYMINEMKDWREISNLIIGRNALQCRNKWQLRIRVVLTQVPWTKQEDEALIQLHKEFSVHGKQNKWSQLSSEIQRTLKSSIYRQPKQCRERWINKLNPDIKNSPWTKEEELSMLKKIALQGKKWTEISKHFNHQKSENSLKSRYQSLIKYEKSKRRLDKIDPQLFEQIQKIRENCISLEEIDHHEWQYIVLAIKRLEEQMETQINQTPDQTIKQVKSFQVMPFKKLYENPKFCFFDTKKMKLIDCNLSLAQINQVVSQSLQPSNQAELGSINNQTNPLSTQQMQVGYHHNMLFPAFQTVPTFQSVPLQRLPQPQIDPLLSLQIPTIQQIQLNQNQDLLSNSFFQNRDSLSISRFLLKSQQLQQSNLISPLIMQDQLLHQSQISMLISAQSLFQQGQMCLNNDNHEQQFIQSINSSHEMRQSLTRNYNYLGESLPQFLQKQNQVTKTGKEVDQMFQQAGIPYFEDSDYESQIGQDPKKPL